MTWTDYLQALGSIATAGALVVAIWVGIVASKSARTTAKQAELFAGAQSATAWRSQVFKLHDKGLTPGQIRYIMHLENGGAGYEGWNGRIDDLVQALPRTASAGGAFSSTTDIPSCDEMPITRDGCTGPCKATIRDSRCEEFRLLDE
jgi:hypothetical protein